MQQQNVECCIISNGGSLCKNNMHYALCIILWWPHDRTLKKRTSRTHDRMYVRTGELKQRGPCSFCQRHRSCHLNRRCCRR